MNMDLNLEYKGLNEIQESEMASLLPEFLKEKELQEMAPNMEVQAEEIRDIFLEFPELKYDQWKELGIEERTSLLNELEKRVAGVEMRDAMQVRHEATDGSLLGSFDGHTLMISDAIIGKNDYDSYKETLNTLFHEGRHAYQAYNLEVCQTEQSDTMVDAWRANLEKLGYEDGKNIFLPSDIGMLRYYTQPIEVDARLFAEVVVNKLGL